MRAAALRAPVRAARDEIARLVRSSSDLASVVRQAEPEDKAETTAGSASPSPTSQESKECWLR
ncbi:hypothetical protein GCM10020367_54750 [Streptomyces sannanensis]|uniref:Uncharacterized protein n=1 Tax=Streptomyces sannanensis TaxID=285536 RepID=A0ABP6SJA6_9ACTN